MFASGFNVSGLNLLPACLTHCPIPVQGLECSRHSIQSPWMNQCNTFPSFCAPVACPLLSFPLDDLDLHLTRCAGNWPDLPPSRLWLQACLSLEAALCLWAGSSPSLGFSLTVWTLRFPREPPPPSLFFGSPGLNCSTQPSGFFLYC